MINDKNRIIEQTIHLSPICTILNLCITCTSCDKNKIQYQCKMLSADRSLNTNIIIIRKEKQNKVKSCVIYMRYIVRNYK